MNVKRWLNTSWVEVDEEQERKPVKHILGGGGRKAGTRNRTSTSWMKVDEERERKPVKHILGGGGRATGAKTHRETLEWRLLWRP